MLTGYVNGWLHCVIRYGPIVLHSLLCMITDSTDAMHKKWQL